MDFNYNVKESYNDAEVKELLNQHYTAVKQHVKLNEQTKWDSKSAELAADLAAAKEAKETIAAQLEEATTQRDDLNAQVTTLTAEVTPMRKTTLQTKFASVTKDLIADSAIEASLEEAEISLEDTEEEAKAKLAKLVESKPYFKKVEVISDDKALLLKKQEAAKKIKAFTNSKHVVGGIAR